MKDPLSNYGGGNLVLQKLASTTPIPFGQSGYMHTWTPSGVFAFVETPSNTMSTWSIEVGSPAAAKTVSLPANTLNPTFVDDQTLLYEANTAPGEHDLMMIDLASMKTRKLASRVGKYAWAPGPRRLFYTIAVGTSSDGIYLINL
jgi:hypothetical protein